MAQNPKPGRSQAHARKAPSCFGLPGIRNQDYRLAAHFCVEARRLIPKDAEVCNLLACTFLKQKSPQEAKVWLHRALRIDPDHVDALVNLGRCLRDEEDLEGSRMHLQHAVDLAPQHSIAVQNLFTDADVAASLSSGRNAGSCSACQGAFDEALMNPWLLFACERTPYGTWT